MKLALAALAVCTLVAAQDSRKHLTVPVRANAQPVSVTADEIERGAQYPAVIHLRGDVEIRMRVCVVTGPGTAQACAGYMVLRADAAEFHEDSGEVQASGNVRVTREQ